MSPSLPDQCIYADAFVLAGGQSRRMGADKSLLNLNGVPLVQHAINILLAARFNPRIAGARSDLSAFAPVIPDDSPEPSLGPLSGICSALAVSSARWAVFLPVDLPLIPPSLIAGLLHQAVATHAAATAFSVAGFIQTFPVVVDRGALPFLRSSLRSNDRNCLTAFRSAARALSRPFSTPALELLVQSGQLAHPTALPAHQWFRNMNSPADLTAVETLLRR